MDNTDEFDEWIERNTDQDYIHTVWEHADTEDELSVSRFEDGTWDVFMNDRLIANRDEPHEAVERARKLMEERRINR